MKKNTIYAFGFMALTIGGLTACNSGTPENDSVDSAQKVNEVVQESATPTAATEDADFAVMAVLSSKGNFHTSLGGDIRAHTAVQNMDTIEPTIAVNSGPINLATKSCGIAKVKPATNAVETTPFKPEMLFVRISTKASGTRITKGVNCKAV